VYLEFYTSNWGDSCAVEKLRDSSTTFMWSTELGSTCLIVEIGLQVETRTFPAYWTARPAPTNLTITGVLDVSFGSSLCPWTAKIKIYNSHEDHKMWTHHFTGLITAGSRRSVAGHQVWWLKVKIGGKQILNWTHQLFYK